MKFDYFKSISSQGEPMTSEKICRWSAGMIETLNRIAQGETSLKKRLPAVAWQASFVGGKRKNCHAVPSGLLMVDVDHIDHPGKVWEEQVASHREELGIVAAHMTPSGKGLRIVAECDPKFDTLAENQKWIGEVCGLEIDACTKDFARLSFLVPIEYFYYLDEGIFSREAKHKFINHDLTNEENENNSEIFGNDSAHNNLHSNGEHLDGNNVQDDAENGSVSDAKTSEIPACDDGADGSVSAGRRSVSCGKSHNGKMSYKGIEYSAIVAEWFKQNGGEPQEGERNVRLFRLACSLRYICDFNAERLYSIIPRFGLPSEEVRALVKSALSAKRGGRIPADLYSVLVSLGIEKPATSEWGAHPTAEAEPEEVEEEPIEDSKSGLPALPSPWKEFVMNAPEQFKEAMVVSMLPVMGTLLTRLRAEYLDGETHAPNFQVVVEAPQASGKSFTRKMVDFLMRPIVMRDALERVKEQQYLAQMKLLKNSKKLPEEPEIIIRSVPATISIAKLLKRLDKSGGTHLFTYLEELDTLTKSNQAGAWSQKTDIYRNAFDNSEYGQDYMSDNSYSAIVRVYYNMLMCGTPRAVSRFYKDPEDGLCSRVVFSKLPDQFGEVMPIWGKMDEATSDTLNTLLDDFMEETYDKNGGLKPQKVVDMKWMHKAVNQWLEDKRMSAIMTQNRALDVFRRRSAVIAFRGAMLVYYCWTRGRKNARGLTFARQRTTAFFTWLAEYTLNRQMEKYGDTLNDCFAEVRPKLKTKRERLFDSLGDTFSLADLQAKCAVLAVKSQAREIIYIWRKNKLIEQNENGSYKKINE